MMGILQTPQTTASQGLAQTIVEANQKRRKQSDESFKNFLRSLKNRTRDLLRSTRPAKSGVSLEMPLPPMNGAPLTIETNWQEQFDQAVQKAAERISQEKAIKAAEKARKDVFEQIKTYELRKSAPVTKKIAAQPATVALPSIPSVPLALEMSPTQDLAHLLEETTKIPRYSPNSQIPLGVRENTMCVPVAPGWLTSLVKEPQRTAYDIPSGTSAEMDVASAIEYHRQQCGVLPTSIILPSFTHMMLEMLSKEPIEGYFIEQHIIPYTINEDPSSNEIICITK